MRSCVYIRVLTATEIQQVEDYLGGKFVPEPATLGFIAVGMTIGSPPAA